MINNNLLNDNNSFSTFQKMYPSLISAVKLNPKCSKANQNLAICCQVLGDFKEASKHIQIAIEYGSPDDQFMLWFNMGNIAVDENDIQKAIVCFKISLQLNPNFIPTKWNLSNVLLLDGQYEEGWELYESRWQQFPNLMKIKNALKDRPLLTRDNINQIKNKTILCYIEQGAGDMLQCIRFLKHLKKLKAKIIVEWPILHDRGDLTDILKHYKYIDQVINPMKQQRYKDFDFDYHVPLTSLPMILELNRTQDLASDPYIDIPEYDLDLACIQQNNDKMKIGIVWAGSYSHHKDYKRSIRFKEFISIFEGLNKHCQLFSLQKNGSVVRLYNNEIIGYSDGLSESQVIDLSSHITNYSDTAIIINQMDLIVTVDTAIVHLAGAIGKPVFVALPKSSDWRWGYIGDKTYWYDSVRLFRQSMDNDWNDVFTNIRQSIRHIIDES